MKPWGRFVFIFIAYGIALLHTGIPHHHGQSGNGKMMFFHAGCSYAHTGAGGFLQKVFSTDLGYGHLETFKKNAETRLEFSSESIAVFGLLIPIFVKPASLRSSAEFLGGYFEKLRKCLLLFATSHFRAPPVMS